MDKRKILKDLLNGNINKEALKRLNKKPFVCGVLKNNTVSVSSLYTASGANESLTMSKWTQLKNNFANNMLIRINRGTQKKNDNG